MLGLLFNYLSEGLPERFVVNERISPFSLFLFFPFSKFWRGGNSVSTSHTPPWTLYYENASVLQCTVFAVNDAGLCCSLFSGLL